MLEISAALILLIMCGNSCTRCSCRILSQTRLYTLLNLYYNCSGIKYNRLYKVEDNLNNTKEYKANSIIKTAYKNSFNHYSVYTVRNISINTGIDGGSCCLADNN